MIAVIIAAPQRCEAHGLDERLPLPLFPLADRPILHHIVDYLAARGVRRFEFVLGHLPEKIEAYLGDGARWGASFGFHLLPEASLPLRLVQTISAGLDDDILLGSGETLPEFELPSGASPTLFVSDAGTWTGWAVLPRGTNLFTQLEAYAREETPAHDGTFAKAVVARQLKFKSAQDLLRSQEDLLTGAFAGSEIGSRQSESGVWISRNVSLHPTVKLHPPLYIGPNCKIEMGVRIGPSVVIGEGCIVDRQSSLANTLVAPGTYIGQGLELEDVVVDRNRLVNARLETECLVSDSFLLSGVTPQKKPQALHQLVSRLTAFAVFLLLFPISALTLFVLLICRRGKFVRERAVRIPAAPDSYFWSEYRYLRLRLHETTVGGWWTYFAAELWPGLISVMKGDLFLVGVKPRSPQEVESLPSDWRSLYLSSKGGLITEAFVMFGRNPEPDELYTAEAYYTAIRGFRHDLKLMRLYLIRLLTNTDRGPAANVAGSSVPNSSLETAAER